MKECNECASRKRVLANMQNQIELLCSQLQRDEYNARNQEANEAHMQHELQAVRRELQQLKDGLHAREDGLRLKADRLREEDRFARSIFAENLELRKQLGLSLFEAST